MQQEHQSEAFLCLPIPHHRVSHAFTKWGIKISQFYFMVHVKIKRIFLYGRARNCQCRPYKMAYRSIGILKFLLKWLYAQWSDIPFYNLLLLTAFVILKSVKNTLIVQNWIQSTKYFYSIQFPRIFSTIFAHSGSTHCLKTSKIVSFVFWFWHFPSIFVLLKLACLVTPFDRKFQKSPNWPFLAF